MSDHIELVTDDHVLWPYGKTAAGYGVTTIGGVREYVHAFACEFHHGPKPEGMCVRHLCGNEHKHCFNGDHLAWGTYRENLLDRRHENVSGRVMSMNKAAALRQTYAAGLTTQMELATRFGISQPVVSKIILGELWTLV